MTRPPPLCARLTEVEATATTQQVRVERLEHEAAKRDELLFVLLAATCPGDADLDGSDEEPYKREVAPFPSPAFVVASVSVLGLPLPLP